MTYDETILWQRFMQSKTDLNNFTYLYDHHKFDKRSLEEYLEDVAAEDVILSAFDFSGAGNTIFGFKHWKELNEKWMLKLTEFRNSGSLEIEEQKMYCPHCGRLLPRSAFATKSNGVLHKHCKECEGGIWDKQKKEREKEEKEREKQEKAMRQLEKEIAEKQAKLERISAGIEPVTSPDETTTINNRAETAKQQIAEGQANLNKTTKVCSHCGKRKLKSEFPANPASEDGLDAWCKTCQTTATSVSAEADSKQEREEHKPAPIKPDKLTAPKLGEYDATLHYKKGQKSITFNAVLSKQIRDGEFTKCYLNPDRNHRQFLIFNRAEGANITGASSMAQSLLNVNSAEIVRALAARFGLEEGDNYYLHITKNLAPKADVITVEVLKVRTREEYARIAEKREEARKNGEDIPEYEDYEERQEPSRPGELITTDDSVQEDAPILEFADITDPVVAAGKKKTPAEILQGIVDKGLLTEHDIAAFLFHKGWELHEPVVVTKHKKFSL